MPLSKKDMASLRRSPLRCQLRSRNYFIVFAWYAPSGTLFLFRIESLVPLLQTQNFSRLRRWVRCLSPPQGHITRRSIFTFLGLRARTLHFGAERYSDSCCLYGVCGLKSFCFFCSKSVACSCAACDLKKQATNQPTSSAFCCCFLCPTVSNLRSD